MCRYLRLLKNSSGHHLRWLALFKESLFLLLDSCPAPLSTKLHTLTHPPKPFSQSREIWPGQIPGEGQVQLHQGYKEEPLLVIVCSCVHSAGVNTCLHPFDQKKLPCQDFLCLSCVCFRHQRVINSNTSLQKRYPFSPSWIPRNPVLHRFRVMTDTK
jgi:hypothetical protein